MKNESKSAESRLVKVSFDHATVTDICKYGQREHDDNLSPKTIEHKAVRRTKKSSEIALSNPRSLMRGRSVPTLKPQTVSKKYLPTAFQYLGAFPRSVCQRAH